MSGCLSYDYLQEPFELFVDYCAVKKHFTYQPYDIIKYHGKLKVSEKKFRERKDRPFFHYLASVLSKKENIPFFVSQFIDNSNYWIGNILFEKQESMKRYTAWVNRIESMKTNYRIDLTNIARKGYTWKTILGYSVPTHPPLFSMVLKKEITPETYVLIDKISNYIKKTSEAYSDDTIYCELNHKFTKYGSFITVPISTILKLTPKDLQDVN